MIGLRRHFIITGETHIENEPFAVILADDLFTNENDGLLKQMIEVYEKYQCSTILPIEEVPMD